MIRLTIKAGQGAEISEAVTAYIEKKVNALERFVGKDESLCEIELRKETGMGKHGDIYYAEANLTVGPKLYRATAHKNSYEAALDVVKDTILTELRQSKQRRLFSVKDGGARLKRWLTGGAE
jgi:ribosomal subunit interface protein